MRAAKLRNSLFRKFRGDITSFCYKSSTNPKPGSGMHKKHLSEACEGRQVSASRRTSTAAPIRSTGSRRVSSPNTPGTAVHPRAPRCRPERSEPPTYVPDMTIIDLPSFKPDHKRHGGREGSDTQVAIDFTRKIVLICGSSYAGEMKKSVFTTLNFYLPAQA